MRENRAPVSLVLAARRKLPRTRGSSAAALGSVPSIHRGEANAPDGNLELFFAAQHARPLETRPSDTAVTAAYPPSSPLVVPFPLPPSARGNTIEFSLLREGI